MAVKLIDITKVYFCNTLGARIDIIWEKAKNNNFDYFIFNKTLFYTKEFAGKVNEPYEFDYSFTQNISKKSQIENIDISEVFWNDKRDQLTPMLSFIDLVKVKELKYKYIFYNGQVFKIVVYPENGDFSIKTRKLEKGTYTIDSTQIENYK